MRVITIHNLSIQFDADQITHGEPLDQAGRAVELINGELQRQPYGLGAQIIVGSQNPDIDVEDRDVEEEAVTLDVIRAEVHPDDHAMEIYFNAAKWFEQATDDAILKLSRCEATHHPDEWLPIADVWGQDNPSDDVAHHMAGHNPEVAAVFTYLEHSKACKGFECYIHGDDARAWIAGHRPHLLDKLTEDEE